MTHSDSFQTSHWQHHSSSRREEARLSIDILGSYSLIRTGEKADFRLHDIGGNGIGGKVNSLLDVGNEIKIEFTLDERALQAVCSVVSSRANYIGLKYITISDEDLNYIKEYVRIHFFKSDKNRLD